MELLLISFALLWFIRRAVEDGWAASQGRESPRIARRRAQHELAQRHRADTGAPTIGQAVTGRIAQRIAEPRERGALRRFVAELWEDSWVDASDWHRARRARRDRQEQGDPDVEETVLDSRPCSGGCGRWVAGELDLCSACVESRYTWHYDDPDPDLDEDPDPIPDEPPAPPQADTRQHDPVPPPAPAPLRKEAQPVTTPTTIDGDTISPLDNLAFATGCLNLNAAIAVELDTIIGNLNGAGVGPALIQAVADVKAAADQFGVAADRARAAYAQHVATQADIVGDTELRDTVAGTYLDAAHA